MHMYETALCGSLSLFFVTSVLAVVGNKTTRYRLRWFQRMLDMILSVYVTLNDGEVWFVGHVLNEVKNYRYNWKGFTKLVDDHSSYIFLLSLPNAHNFRYYKNTGQLRTEYYNEYKIEQENRLCFTER